MANARGNASWHRDLLWLGLGLGLFYFATLWVRPLASPDESRYTEIPREMVARGDWVTPRLNGVLYFEKPPLCYWLGAISIKVAGVNEAAQRVWPAALGWLTCLMVYGTGRRLYGRTAGLASALVLSTTLLWFALSQILTLDMAVSAFSATALCLFLLAVREPPSRTRLGLMLGVYVFLGLATLAKGLMGFLVPGAIMFLWTLLLNQWRRLVPLHLLIGVPLFLAITVPWHVLAALATPAHDGVGFFSTSKEGQGFLWYYLVNEHFLRYLTPDHERTEPFWFFFAVLPAGLFPWVTLLPQAMKSAFTRGWSQRKERQVEWFLTIWVVFILLFFSASQSKLIPYVLPVYPALALLLGRFLARVWAGEERTSLRGALYALGLALALAAVAGPIALTHRKWGSTGAMIPLTTALTLALALCAFAAVFFARSRHQWRGLLAPIVCAATIMLLFNPLAGQVGRPSAKELCLKLKPRLTADTPVFCLKDYYQEVPLYLERTVGIADFKFENPNFEQSFGMSLEDHGKRYLDRDAFLAVWRGPRRVYAIASVSKEATFTEKNPDWRAHVVFTDGNFVLLSNQPDS